MPVIVVEEAVRSAALATMAPELDALLIDKEVSTEMRGILAHLGVTKFTLFANLASSEEAFRAELKEDLGIEDKAPIAVRLQLSAIIEAWKAARERLKAKEEAAAESRATGRQQEMIPEDAVSLRDAFERHYGEVEDSDFPSRDFVAWRFAQFETGRFVAEELIQVISVREGHDHKAPASMTLEFAPTSSKVVAVRKPIEVPLPANTEELRKRITLMKRVWQVCGLKYGDRSVMVGLDHTVWDRFLEYLLGDKVWGYRSRNNVGLRWVDLIEYEYQVRRTACKAMSRNGTPFHLALEAAWKDTALHQEYFTLQLCTSGATVQGAGLRTQEANPSDKRKQPNETGNGAELKRLKTQIENLTRPLKEVRYNQFAASSEQTIASQRFNPQKGGKGKGKGKVEGGGHRDPNKAEALRQFRQKERYERFLAGSKTPVCSFYQTGSCFNGDACPAAHVCLRCHKNGHTCLDAECKAQPKKR